MKDKIINLKKNKFIKNVLILATGTAAAQLITMILSPIITRMYGPEAFGMLGVFQAVLNILTPIAALTYPIAIVLPKKEEEVKGLIRLSLLITITIATICFILLYSFKNKIIVLFNLNEISSFLYLIPVVIVFAGIMQVTEQWLIRTKQFRVNARVTYLNSIIINTSKIGIGSFYPIPSVLITLSALGDALKAVMMVLWGKKFTSNIDSKNVMKKISLREIAKKYYDFPVFRAPEVFINAISQGLPVLLLTAFFGPASSGFYTIGRTVLRMPSQLIGKSVGDVFYPRIVEAAQNKENITSLIKKATLTLSVIGILPFGIVILFGPTLFSLVFGDDWIVAGEYARYIALWTYFGFINRPSVRSLPVLNAQKFHLIFTLAMLVLRVIALALGYILFSNDIVAIALFSITGAILNFGLITITLKLSKSFVDNYRH